MTRNFLRKARTALIALGLPALALAGFSGSDVFIAMAGRMPGIFPSDWYTTVWIHNPGADAAIARIHFLERGTANPSPPFVDVLVAPGDTEKLENVVGTLFHAEAFGALRVTCATEKLVVTARVFTQAAGAGEDDSLGQDFAGVPASFAIGIGERTQILGVHQTVPSGSSEHRYNFGFVETAGAAATVRVTAYDGNNADQGFKDFQVREWSQRQVAFKDHFPAVSTENSRLEVEVIAGAGKVIAYGSMVSNGAQDPTTFEMAYPERVLAENAAAGITGVTAGQGLAGGGTSGTVTLDVGAGAGISVSADQVSLADGGVTNAKLAANAVTSTKVLDGTISSADVAFDYAGSSSKGGAASDLELPFSGTGGQADPAAVLAITNTGTGPAILGTSSSLGAGVRGIGTTGVEGSSSTGTGVLGQTNSWYGVHGISGSGFGVRGDSTDSDGVFGVSVNHSGVRGWSLSASAPAVQGENAAGGIGVRGQSTVIGVYGINLAWGNEGYLGTAAQGAYGRNGTTDNYGSLGGNDAGVSGSGAGSYPGVYGTSATGAGVVGVSTASDGVRGESSTGTAVYGDSATGWAGYFRGPVHAHSSAPDVLYVENTNSGRGIHVLAPADTAIWAETTSGFAAVDARKAGGLAGYFGGNVGITGSLSKGSGAFKIDHPLDPENKYLYHSFVESPDMKNVYDGVITTDADGRAVVELPEWFEALNRDFRYQLTVIGRFAQAIVEEKVASNRFTIRTNLANVEVSWQVTGIRRDPFANANRIQVEEDKSAEERGAYLHPEAWGQPRDRSVEHLRNGQARPPQRLPDPRRE